jgi:rubredoxin
MCIRFDQEDFVMDRYMCSVCGYLYDPESGDPANGIEPGTSFKELPYSWRCPVCSAAKDMFSKEGSNSNQFFF